MVFGNVEKSNQRHWAKSATTFLISGYYLNGLFFSGYI
jgi:hypothetical protein